MSTVQVRGATTPGGWTRCKAGNTHRPNSALPGHEDICTPPHHREQITGQINLFYAKESESENSIPHLNQVHSVTNPLYYPDAYDDMMYNHFQGWNTSQNDREAQYPSHSPHVRQVAMVDSDMVRDMAQELNGWALGKLAFYDSTNRI